MKFCKLLLFSYFVFQSCYGYELCRLLSASCQLCIADKLCLFVILNNEDRLCVFQDSVLDYSIRTKASSNRKCEKLQDTKATTALPTLRVFQMNPTVRQAFYDFGNLTSSTSATTTTPTPTQSFRDFQPTTIASQANQDFQTTKMSDLFGLNEPGNALSAPSTTPEPPDQFSTNIYLKTSTSDHFSTSTTTLQIDKTVFNTISSTETTTIPNDEVQVNSPTQQHTLVMNAPTSSHAPETHYLNLPVHASVIIQDHNESSDTPFIFITANVTGPLTSHKQPATNLVTTPLIINYNENLSDETTDVVSNSSLTENITSDTISDYHSTHATTNSVEDQLPLHSNIEKALPTKLPTEAISQDESWKTEDYVIAVTVSLLVIGIILMWTLLISFYKRRPFCNFAWLNSSNYHRGFPREHFELQHWVYADQGNLTENTTSLMQREAESSHVVNLMPSSSNDQYWDIPL